jgi:putative spermidine/putrescine transport system permease protein
VRTRRFSFYSLTVTVLLLIPLAVVVAVSVNPGEYTSFPPDGFSLRWFSAALSNGPFLDALSFSAQLAAATVLVGLAIGVPAALALVRSAPRVRNLVQVAALGPLVAPEVLLGLGLLLLFNTQVHLGSGFVALLLGHVLVALPLGIQVMVAGFAQIDRNVEQAAWTLGASPLRSFLLVSLPQMAPTVAGAGLFLFIFSFDNVSISLFLTAPGQTTLPIQMYQYLEYRADPTVAAMSTVLVGLGLLACLVASRLGGLGQLARRGSR